MDERDRDGALADRRCDALDIAAPDVTDREHAGQTGFEKMGRPGERPLRGRQIVLRQFRSGLDEAFGIEGDAPSKPLRAGNGAGHDEDVPDVMGLDLAGLTVPPAHPFEMVAPFEGDDFAVRL